MKEKHSQAYSVEKIKNLGKCVGGLSHREEHNLRIDIPDNADPEKTKDNKIIIPLKYNSYVDAFKEITGKAIHDGSMKKIRKNAVLAAEVIATYTQEINDKQSADINSIDNNEDEDIDAAEIVAAYNKKTYTKEDLDKWVNETVEFTAKQFGGKENIISAVLHMDENSPHIHMIIIPMNEKSRLCYKSFIDGPASLSSLQDDYYNEIGKKYGLERGTKHKTYRKAANNMKNISAFRAATIGKAVIDAEKIAVPHKNELRDNGDIIPELYVPRIQKEIQDANFSHLKEKNALSAEVNAQESDLIGYYLNLQEDLKKEYKNKEEALMSELENQKISLKQKEYEAEQLEKEYRDKLSKFDELLNTIQGSVVQGDISVNDIRKILNADKYLEIGLKNYPDKKKVEKFREMYNEIIEHGRNQFHNEKDEDIKKINKIKSR